jgi:hypothetical protein
MKCLTCKKDHDGTFGSGKYCSRKCANSRGPRTEEFKSILSAKLKGKSPSNKGKEMKQRLIKSCPTCCKEFKVTQKSDKTYCSGKCNPDWGGFREKSGRAKTGYYREIYCGSSYELMWVIHALDHNIKFKRFEGKLKGDNISYIPDFLIDENAIIEIKWFEDKEKVLKKTELAESQGYNVKILYKEDLKDQFEWVNNNYSFKYVNELYDDYKPKYVYNCSNCNAEVAREQRSKTEVVFCSRKCSGKGHKGRREADNRLQ